MSETGHTFWQVDFWQAETADAKRIVEGDDSEMQQLRTQIKQHEESAAMLLAEDIERAQQFEAMKDELAKWRQTAVRGQVTD